MINLLKRNSNKIVLCKIDKEIYLCENKIKLLSGRGMNKTNTLLLSLKDLSVWQSVRFVIAKSDKSLSWQEVLDLFEKYYKEIEVFVY